MCLCMCVCVCVSCVCLRKAKSDAVKTEWVTEIRTLLEAQAAQLKERWTSQRSVDSPTPTKGVVIETDINPIRRQKSDA
jgi:hypothetical protein